MFWIRSRPTKSTLLRISRSAKPICQSLNCICSGAANICSASITQVMLSSRMRSRTLASFEGNRDPGRIGHTAGFEQHVFGPLRTIEHTCDRFEQVTADRAAHAAIGETDHITLDADDEFGINIDGAEIVHEDCHSQAMVAVEEAVEQRRLAGAEKAGDDCKGSGPP